MNKPLDGATEEEALAIAMLLGFEWTDADEQYCQWYPCEVCGNCAGYSLSCWGAYFPCTRENAMWRFLLNKGLISKIPGSETGT